MIAKKSRQANLERLRFPLLLIGLTFSGALVLSAFEWRSYDEIHVEQDEPSIIMSSLEDETIFAAIPEKKPVPKRKRVQKPVIDVVNIVSNETRIDIALVMPELGIDEEPDIVDIGGPVEIISEKPVFMVVEEMPTFPGGVEALYNFLGSEIKYPAQARDASVQGKVHVSFVVGEDGMLRDIKILRGIGAGCDDEALRVIGEMPKWNPGKQRGRNVAVQFGLPINFVLN